MSIYDKGWLMKFLNPENQPQQMRNYLDKESKLLKNQILKGTSLIDFGCGYGRHLELLQKRLTYGLGIDNVEDYVEFGKKKLRNFSNLELIKADVLNIELEKKFDYAICMNNTLGNIEKKDRLISQMKKAITYNGIIIAGVYSKKSIDARIEWYNNTGLKIKKITNDYIETINGFKSWHFSKNQLNELFKYCIIKDITRIGYLIICKNNKNQ